MARELDEDELIERWTLIGDDLEVHPPKTLLIRGQAAPFAPRTRSGSCAHL